AFARDADVRRRAGLGFAGSALGGAPAISRSVRQPDSCARAASASSHASTDLGTARAGDDARPDRVAARLRLWAVAAPAFATARNASHSSNDSWRNHSTSACV